MLASRTDQPPAFLMTCPVANDRHRSPLWAIAGSRSVVAVLLLLAMSLGMLHRASDGGCPGPAGARAVDVARSLPGHGASGALLATAHHHVAPEPPVAASVPGGCGPAVLDTRAVPSAPRRLVETPVERRASAPALLAAPPPAPPPRLS